MGFVFTSHVSILGHVLIEQFDFVVFIEYVRRENVKMEYDIFEYGKCLKCFGSNIGGIKLVYKGLSVQDIVHTCW